MLRFSIGPVQRFVEEARTTRDLWIRLRHFLLSDLIWHAMLPIVKRYGPDCIVYPDLRGNPLVDVWLNGENPQALPEYARNPSTFAAMLPNVFVALVPRGGTGHLLNLEILTREAQVLSKNVGKTLLNKSSNG
ncbi:MAG: type III-B CRISPR-associated protein Cas10/Cmr2 [Candidatus Competibacteraceae bacterium]